MTAKTENNPNESQHTFYTFYTAVYNKNCFFSDSSWQRYFEDILLGIFFLNPIPGGGGGQKTYDNFFH